MTPTRPVRTAPLLSPALLSPALLLPVLALAVLVPLLAGCGGAGEVESAGRTPDAVGPTRLWPQLPPTKPEYPDNTEAAVEVVEGVDVPGRDLHRVDPVAVVKAEAAAHPATYTGPDALPADTAAAIRRCPAGRKPDQVVKGCPVLQSYYRDLTGNGKDELIVGITFGDGSLGIRVYSVDAGRLIRIMSTAERVTGVELAGRDLIVHEPAQSPEYEIRYAWSWDAGQRAMLPARIEIVRIEESGSPSPGHSRAPGSATPSAGPSSTPSTPPSTTPSATPSAGSS